MRKTLITLVILLFFIQPLTVSADMSCYYYNPVQWAINNNITNNNQFNPDKPCTRGEFVTFLWRANGCPLPLNQKTAFVDVSTEAYYYNAVLWAYEQGITTGVNDTHFAPDKTCTRGQVVTFLWRYMKQPVINNISNPFHDISTNTYYYKPILWAINEGITNGTSSTTFAPDETCTRGQTITFLWRTFNQNINAADYGLSPENSGHQNSLILQKLVDDISVCGGTVYIPSGEYYFEEIGTQHVGSHCIKMKSNVSIIGNGNDTILKPIGSSKEGLDMFYFNDLKDYHKPVYLENCRFENFVIDASGTSCEEYTSAGKGFMFNLFKNCHWDNVVVKNTDATGFGVDCPINSSMINCTAINCGKAATIKNQGASGFGIGFGFAENEDIQISHCKSVGNKKFGFFFEHQGRFDSSLYTAKNVKELSVSDCEASDNYYNFGGIVAMNTFYRNCTSRNAKQHGYFLENSKNCKVINCTSEDEHDTAFVILQSHTDGGKYEVCNISYEYCVSNGSKYGAKIVSYGSTKPMYNNHIENCQFNNPEIAEIYRG